MVTRSSKQVRYAVAGLGHIAQKAVLPAFAQASRNSVLSALISSDPEKLATLGEQYGVAVRGGYQDFERCLREVDAVYIATPNSEHEDLAVRAAHAGVHVLCEKPLAVTDEACQRMIQACREADVKIMTAYRLHFEPLMIEVLEHIRSGHIGQARFFTSSFSLRAKPGIRTNPALGGGTLYDLGVYCINAARLVFGAEPTQVFGCSIEGTRAGMPGVDEMTSAVLRFEDERLATFTSSFAAADVSSFRVVGTEGDIHMQPAYEYAEPLAYTLTQRDGKTQRRRGKKRDQFAAELLYFSECVLKNRAPEPSGKEGARDVQIVEALYESARRNEPIAPGRFGPDPAPVPAQAIDRPPSREPELVNVESPHD